MTRTCVSAGKGMRATSLTAVSLHDEPSVAKIIFITLSSTQNGLPRCEVNARTFGTRARGVNTCPMFMGRAARVSGGTRTPYVHRPCHRRTRPLKGEFVVAMGGRG